MSYAYFDEGMSGYPYSQESVFGLGMSDERSSARARKDDFLAELMLVAEPDGKEA